MTSIAIDPRLVKLKNYRGAKDRAYQAFLDNVSEVGFTQAVSRGKLAPVIIAEVLEDEATALLEAIEDRRWVSLDEGLAFAKERAAEHLVRAALRPLEGSTSGWSNTVDEIKLAAYARIATDSPFDNWVA